MNIEAHRGAAAVFAFVGLPLEDDQVAVADVDYAIQTSAADQRALVGELARARPRAIVRWTARASTVRQNCMEILDDDSQYDYSML